MATPDGVDDRLADVVRIEGARILATLVRTTGNWTVAEDAVQEAAIAALRDRPRTGVPEDARAWLVVAARRKAIDILRREQHRADKERAGMDQLSLFAPDPPPDSVVRDDQLRLIFTCCHPALSLDAQVALALRTLCQLSVEQVAAVLLSSPSTMAKRLTRTRQKIVAAHIPYRIPSDAEIPERLAGVCAAVHALYTAGHAPLSGSAVLDVDVCGEAVRLARLVHTMMPDEATPTAVLALLLLTEARRAARTDPAGDVVLLSDQDRTQWDRAAIEEGTALLGESLRRTLGVANSYQLQAAIAAEHARAEHYAATDWNEILRLYDLLLGVNPTPAAALARAVAVGERDGPGAGLGALAEIPPSSRVHAVHAEFLARDGRWDEAVRAVDLSLSGHVTEPERRCRQARRREWSEESAPGASSGRSGRLADSPSRPE